MATTVNIKPRSFSPRCTSRDPNGLAAVPESPFSVIGNVTQGNEVILRTSSLNFGGVSPEFVRRVLLQPGNAGSDYIPSANVNYETGRLVKNGLYYQTTNTAQRIPVHAVAGMPNGVAFAIGDKSTDPLLKIGDGSTTTSINIETSKYFTEKFEHCYSYFPDANQENIRNELIAGADFSLFNTKQNWTGREGENYDGNNTNIYNGIFRFKTDATPSALFVNPTTRVSNVASQGSSYLPTSGEGINTLINSAANNKILPFPICYQTASKISGIDGYDWMKLVANSGGGNPLLCDYTAQNLAVNIYPNDYPIVELRGQPFSNEFNQQKLFGFLRGYGINWGFNSYACDHFLQFGPGARARVEIVDLNNTFNVEQRISVMTPTYWSLSGKELAFKVESGIFHGESLSGKMLRVYNYVGQLVGERLIA